MINAKMAKEKNDISQSKRLGFGYFIAAAVFLANPCLNIVDILPDFFGYVFLLKGLTKWADLCPNVRDAVTGLSKLRWVMLLKLFAAFLVPLVDETYVLLFTFSFAVLELIFVLPAAFRIFDGLEYFGTRFDGKNVFRRIKNARTLTIVFFILKSAFCLFPELCELSSFEYSGVITSGMQTDPASYKNPLIILNLVVCTAIGILWLIEIIRYTASVFQDGEFLARVLRDYDLEIGDDVGLAVRRTLRSAVTVLIAGFAFFPNLFIDGINIIPTFVGAAFLIAAISKLSRISAVSKSAKASAVALIIVSSLSFVSMLTLETVISPEIITDDIITVVSPQNAEMTDIEILERSVAENRLADNPFSVVMFAVYLLLCLAEHILMAVCTYKIFREIRRLIACHLAPDPDVTDRRLTDIYIDGQREANRTVTAGQIIFTVAIILSTVYGFIRTAIAPSYYLIPLIATTIWVAYMANTLNNLYEQIEYKYM